MKALEEGREEVRAAAREEGAEPAQGHAELPLLGEGGRGRSQGGEEESSHWLGSFDSCMRIPSNPIVNSNDNVSDT